LNADDARRRREETSIQVRKTKKEEILNSKRRMMDAGSFIAPDASEHGTQRSEQTKLRLSQISQYVADVMNEDPASQLRGTTQFRKLLSIEHNPPIQEVINSNVVPRFIGFLSSQNPSIQFEAAWVLTNIASGSSHHTRIVVESGAVPIFVQLLSSSNDDVREQAVWALGNIAGDSIECRDYVIGCGIVIPLINLLMQSQQLNMLRNATWTLSNLCRGKPMPDFSVLAPAIPVLAHLINTSDIEIVTDACWALSYLSDGPNERIQLILDTNITGRLVELLSHELATAQVPALRVIGNIVTGDDHQTQAAIQAGVLSHFSSLLRSPKKGIRKETCWSLSNIMAGTSEQISSVIMANLIPDLIFLLGNGEFDIRKEIAWAFSNASSSGTRDQIKFFVDQGCIAPLCELLAANDSKIVEVALDAIANILKSGEEESRFTGSDENPYALAIIESDGISKLEALQEHKTGKIYNKVITIMGTYFEADEEDEEDEENNVSVQTTANGQQFLFGTNQSTSTRPQFAFGSSSTSNQFNFGGKMF
jgi:importin subunit alpha-1